MKNLFIVLSSLIIFASCGPTKQEVITFNDQLVNKIKKASNAEAAFYDVCKSYNPEKIKAELANFNSSCNSVKAEIETMEAHKDIEPLKASALALILEYIRVEPDFKEYARLYSIPDEAYTKDDEATTSAIASKINNELDTEFKDFQLKQDEFGTKYNYIITKTSTKEKQ